MLSAMLAWTLVNTCRRAENHYRLRGMLSAVLLAVALVNTTVRLVIFTTVIPVNKVEIVLVSCGTYYMPGTMD